VDSDQEANSDPGPNPDTLCQILYNWNY